MEFERFALRAGILHESQNYLGGGGGLAGSVACVASVSNRVIARKLEVEGGGGGGGGAFLPRPLPRHPFFFFSRPSFSRRTRAETLATQASWFLLSPPPPRHSFFFLSSQLFSTNLARKRLQRRLEEARKIEGL